jgi:GNAT superfamily N-acetyltransferase
VQRRELDGPSAIREAIRIHGLAWRVAYEGLLPADILDAVTVEATPGDIDRWLERLSVADGVALGVAVEGTVRGYTFLRWAETKSFVRDDEAELRELYVHPNWWGRGIGTTLVQWALDELPTDRRGIALETLVGNDSGRAFYDARGFTADGHSQLDIAGVAYDTVVYRRRV